MALGVPITGCHTAIQLRFGDQADPEEIEHMTITPYLLYEDVSGALRFLSKAFGFRKCGASMKGPDGKLNHAAMQFRDGIVMMGYPGQKYKNPKRLGQSTQSLYVIVDDVDKHFARARKAGAMILEEPQNTFYGHRRYGAEDPEGHQWYFAQEIKAGAARKRTARNSKPARSKAS